MWSLCFKAKHVFKCIFLFPMNALSKLRHFCFAGFLVTLLNVDCFCRVFELCTFFSHCRRTRIRRRAKMRSTAQSWRPQRTAPLRGWWTCTVGTERLQGRSWWSVNPLKSKTQTCVCPSLCTFWLLYHIYISGCSCWWGSLVCFNSFWATMNLRGRSFDTHNTCHQIHSLLILVFFHWIYWQ